MAKNTNNKTKAATRKSVETLTHDEATRKNIPTAEFQSVMAKEHQSPIRVAYERRNRDLDPQLVWRGKDEQDWSDLVVQAPPLFLVNRPGNRPSHEHAAMYGDAAIRLLRGAGFRKITFRGDTDFTQTTKLDEWDAQGVRFIFGIDARENLVKLAEHLPKSAWKPLERKAKYEVKTQPRRRPENVKERIVRENEYENIRLNGEEVAEFAYRPTACRKTYRIVVVRKDLTVDSGQKRLFEQYRYFFYLTNDEVSGSDTIVYEANGRCHQENLIEQLKNGVHALRMPVNDLVSNWAYMVMAALAWSLKAWFALIALGGTGRGRWHEKHEQEKSSVLRMEFKKFVNTFIRVPAQVIRGGRKLIFRLLSWNPWQEVFLRGVEALRSRKLAASTAIGASAMLSTAPLAPAPASAERACTVSGDVTGSVAVGGFAAEPVNESGAINIVSEMTELFVHQCAECDVV
jgi:hypothetical protein